MITASRQKNDVDILEGGRFEGKRKKCMHDNLMDKIY